MNTDKNMGGSATSKSAEMGLTSDKDIDRVQMDPESVTTNAVFVDSEESINREAVMRPVKLLPVVTDMDYSSFYARPFKARTGTIGGSGSPNTLQYRDISTWPADYSSWYTSKLQGVYSFRGSLTVRLVVNANKMQSGILRFRAVPAMATSSPLAFANGQHLAYLLSQTSMSTLPGFDIDLACSHSGEITLPWIFPEASIIAVSSANWVLCVSQYIALGVGDTGSNSIDWTMYLSHPDFESYGSSGTAIYQSGRVKSSEKKEAGIITRTLQKTSESFGHLTKVPFIGSYMSSLSSIASSLSKAAGVWGWASHPIFTPHQRMVPESVGSLTITNQPKVVRSFGLVTSQTIPDGKPVGPPIDELAISAITSKYAWYQSFSWENQVSGDVLYSVQVDPNLYFSQIDGFTGTNNNYTRFIYTPLTYCARMFNNWRGTIKFRFDMGRTVFHSGRIVVVYAPVATAPVDNHFTYRKVVDITEASHFEFEVPYLLPFSTQVDSATKGTIRVLVVDALQAPTGVRKRVDVAISVAGGHDFTLSNYVGRFQRAVIEPAPCEKLGPGFVFQSGCLRETPEVEDMVTSEQFDVANTGVIERSFRSLLKLESPLYWMSRSDLNVVTLVGGDGRLSPVLDGNYRLFKPHTEFLLPPRTFPASNTVVFTADLYSALAPLFYASKGGVRWRFTTPSDVIKTTRVGMNIVYTPAGTITYNDGDTVVSPANYRNLSTRATVYQTSFLPERSVLLEFPQMLNKPFRKTIMDCMSTAPAFNQRVNPLTNCETFVQTGIPFSYLHRSTAEDFDFMFFLGVPIQVAVNAPIPDVGI